ncbi:phosphotransferase [Actinokineospora enzanensis]|uniref:phosphotransferase n=1 Tax=Actinokineospora enzanensis TaxID=155975 RepID=UPI00036C0C9B|nr:phosphotransferase [Actinokineospora enzanensis]
MTTDTGDADARFRQWMRENLDRAAKHFGVTVTGEPLLGWIGRTVSAPVTKNGADYWLRVASEDQRWASGNHWTGNLAANVFTDLAKPQVLDMVEWEEWRLQRAEIMTRMPGCPCSPTDVLRAAVDFPDEWWAELRRTTDTVAAMRTERVNSTQEKVTERLAQRFGHAIDPTVLTWETVHGDLHWANLLCPEFGLLDWELWGRGPVGTDAATLLSYSLLVPETAERVREVYADVLGTSVGRLAQLYVIARLSRRIEGGDYPDLAEPLKRHAAALLEG